MIYKESLFNFENITTKRMIKTRDLTKDRHIKNKETKMRRQIFNLRRKYVTLTYKPCAKYLIELQKNTA